MVRIDVNRSRLNGVLLLIAFVLVNWEPLLAGGSRATEGQVPLSAEAAWTWYNHQPWIVGFNYIPATAITPPRCGRRKHSIPPSWSGKWAPPARWALIPRASSFSIWSGRVILKG